MTNDDGDDWYIDDVCVQAGLSTTDNEILDMMVYPNDGPVDGNYVTILSYLNDFNDPDAWIMIMTLMEMSNYW